MQSERDKFRDKLVREQLGAGTVQGSVNAFCIHCIFDANQKGSWREQVKVCDHKACPLFTSRPGGGAERAIRKDVQNKCKECMCTTVRGDLIKSCPSKTCPVWSLR